MKCFSSPRFWCAVCAICVPVCGVGVAQQESPVVAPSAQAAPAATPNAPSTQQGKDQKQGETPPNADEEQTKRIMGMLPNFRSVTAGEQVPPETPRQKLLTATEDNFDYTSLFFAGVIAANSFLDKATPEFHQGAAGYARYYWHTVADQGVENYLVELIVPAITHEDSRYFAMGREGGGFARRLEYSLSRVFVTRKDSGARTFNYSEIAGSAAAVSISTFYYPSPERTVKNGVRDWGLDITYDAVTFAFHEFWPDISHAVFGPRSRKTLANP